jgi:hypothetical protein
VQVVAAAVTDATTLLSDIKVGTISVLAAAALMPVRNGFTWDAASKSFKFDPVLRQVGAPAWVLVGAVYRLLPGTSSSCSDQSQPA